MSHFSEAIPALAAHEFHTIMYVGAGSGDVLDDCAPLRWERLILIEGDIEALAQLRVAAVEVENVDVVEIAVAAEPGPITWCRYTLPALNGPVDAFELAEVYPSLQQLSTTAVQARQLDDVVHANLPSSDASDTDLLVLDVPGQEASLVGALTVATLHRFAWVLVIGGGPPESQMRASFQAAADTLAQAGYASAERMVRDSALWQSRLFRLDLTSLERRALKSRLAALEGDLRAAQALAEERLEAVAALKTSLQTAQQALNDRQHQVDNLNEALRTITGHEALLRNERATLLAARDERDARHSEEAGRHAQLREEFRELTARHGMLQEELIKAEAQLELIADLLVRNTLP